MKIVLFVEIVSIFFEFTSGELYSALAGMEALLDTQKAIIRILDRYIDLTEKKTAKLRKIREDYSYLKKVSSNSFQDFISNPINAFALMKKLTVDWDEVKRELNRSPMNEIHEDSVIFPDENDLSGAAKALLRVQQTYNLKTAELADGEIHGAPSGLRLTADDCFEIGRQAFHSGFYENAISWLENAKKKFEDSNGEVINSTEVSRYLMWSTYAKGRFSLLQLTNSLLQLSFMMAPSLDSFAFTNSVSLDKEDSNNGFLTHTTLFDEASYRQLCQSSMRTVTPLYSSQLSCHLLSHHPYLLLQPIKEEKLWKEPKISIFHDVISEKEIEIMKTLALPVLQRAEVAEYNKGLGHRVSETRVTKVAWLREEDHPLIPKMYSRIEAITGLSSNSAEPFQMANYGLGGHFHLHMDVLPDTENYFGPNLGNRIATWLTYCILSYNEQEGTAVFAHYD
ncbi:prolyl 4-hydroxylase subunit alpha-2-like [Parasteatoda tepidariorum]|uniref:prolyl 4-hydroxylase subunit alpha-2-like n=1 Tax=Parasteatoda tepidariorum TaxID=114398 RepID=UPI0039BCA130